MYKQIYDKGDGTPKLIKTVVNEDTGEDEFQYDGTEYTDIAPPTGIYQPIYFLDDEWHGLTREQWLKQQSDPEPTDPSQSEIEVGTLQMELFKLQVAVGDLREENAQLVKEVVALRGEN